MPNRTEAAWRKAPPVASGKLLSLRLFSTLLKTPRQEAVAVILFGEHLVFRTFDSQFTGHPAECDFDRECNVWIPSSGEAV